MTLISSLTDASVVNDGGFVEVKECPSIFVLR